MSHLHPGGLASSSSKHLPLHEPAELTHSETTGQRTETSVRRLQPPEQREELQVWGRTSIGGRDDLLQTGTREIGSGPAEDFAFRLRRPWRPQREPGQDHRSPPAQVGSAHGSHICYEDL